MVQSQEIPIGNWTIEAHHNAITIPFDDIDNIIILNCLVFVNGVMTVV